MECANRGCPQNARSYRTAPHSARCAQPKLDGIAPPPPWLRGREHPGRDAYQRTVTGQQEPQKAAAALTRWRGLTGVREAWKVPKPSYADTLRLRDKHGLLQSPGGTARA